MNEVMLALGSFRFSLDTAAYQTLTRSQSWNWVEQPLLGGTPAQQYLGKANPTLTLRGVIYPEHRGGYDQISQMAREAEMAQPLDLLAFDNSTAGVYLGRWVILDIVDDQTAFRANGAPRRIEFNIVLRRYAE